MGILGIMRRKQAGRRERVIASSFGPGERVYIRKAATFEDVLIFPVGPYHRDGKEREFTREDAAEMVRNFEQNILERQEGRLPVNREHQREGGRLAWITRLWDTDDGVHGNIETQKDRAEEADGFDYLSPEIHWEWVHPYTGKKHRNVLVGAALTNYPFLLGRTAVRKGESYEWTDFMEITAVTPAALQKAPDSEITSMHHRTHQLWGANFEGNTRETIGGLTREDVLNAHQIIVEEMERRGMKHDSPLEAERHALDLEGLPDEIMVTPGAVCVVGSTAEGKKSGDVDILFRFEIDKEDDRIFRLRRENIDLPVRKALSIDKERFHPIDNPQGPHAEAIPLYDLKLVRKTAIRKAGDLIGRTPPKNGLAPGRRYQVMKPGMAGTTEYFSTGELWERWAAEKIKGGHALLGSPKIDGFRAVVSWNGDNLSVWFEDAQETKRFPQVAAALKGQDPFVIEGEYTARIGGKWVARTQLAGAAEGKLESEPHFWLYDLLFIDKDDVSGGAFEDRLARLKTLSLPNRYFSVLSQRQVRTKDQLETVGKWAAGQTLSEGLFIRQADAPYAFGSTDTAAKWKTIFEIKVCILEVIQRQGGHVFHCGLRDPGEYKNIHEMEGNSYVDLSNTFVTSVGGRAGDTVNVRVEELVVLSDDRLAWGKPTVVGLDKSRPAYTAAQAIEMAERGHVLKREISKAGDDEGDTRGEKAASYWAEHWHEVLPRSGGGRFVYQHHWRGLSEEDAGKSDDALMEGSGSVHGDLRLEGAGALWGWTVFLGTAAANRGGDRLIGMGPDDRLQTAAKLAQPKGWLNVGVRSPRTVEPGGPGASTGGPAKFFALDKGSYRLGVCREHSFEIFLAGGKLKGRYIVQYAPVEAGRRVWLITKPEDQSPYAEKHEPETVIKELRSKGQQWLVWSDGKGRPQFVDVAREGSSSYEHVVEFSRVDAMEHIAYAVVYEPDVADTQRMDMTAEEIEKACHLFMERMQLKSAIEPLADEHHQRFVGSDEVRIIECWIQREPVVWEQEGIHQEIAPGSWCIGLKFYSEDLWQQVLAEEIIGVSMRGWGKIRTKPGRELDNS